MGYAAMYWPCLGTYFTLNGGRARKRTVLSIFIFESAYNQTGESATNQDRYNEFKYCICSKMKALSFTKALDKKLTTKGLTKTAVSLSSISGLRFMLYAYFDIVRGRTHHLLKERIKLEVLVYPTCWEMDSRVSSLSRRS